MSVAKKALKSRSEWQVHALKSSPTVIDLTERKLAKIATTHHDPHVCLLATRMLADYLAGAIAVAWEDGNVPVYVALTDRR